MANVCRVLVAALLLLGLLGATHARADATPVDLYRLGNAGSPRLDNVRPVDVGTYQHDGRLWVEAKSGGVSTFSMPQGQKNEWRLPRGSGYPSKLFLHNDHGNHWSWEPAVNMPLDEFVALLRQVQALFQKVQ